MGIEITIQGAIFGLLILIWILGKAIWSIPSLYKKSQSENGGEACVNLILLLSFRVAVIIAVLFIFVFVLLELEYSYDPFYNIYCCALITLPIAGFFSFFVVIITFILGKLSKVQGTTKNVDVLDDAPNVDG